MVRKALLALAGVLLLAAPAQSQTWPSKPIKLVVPFAPGGSADTLGRIVAQVLSESLGAAGLWWRIAAAPAAWSPPQQVARWTIRTATRSWSRASPRM